MSPARILIDSLENLADDMPNLSRQRQCFQ